MMPTTITAILLLATQTCAWVPPFQCYQRHASLQKVSFTTTLATSSGDDHEITLNPLLDTIQASKTVEIFSKVKQMESEGHQVTSLCVGEPDYPPPQVVIDAIAQAATSGQTRYTAVTGTLALRQAISNDLKRRKQVDYTPAQIVVGNGAKQCVLQAIWATCAPHDFVLVPAPYWPSYPEMVKLVGATPVIIETQPDDGYLLTPQALRQALEEHGYKVKALILCNPSNPTGGVHNQQRLEELATVLLDYPKVAVIADEIYERLVYPASTSFHDDTACPCFASILNGQLWHRTLTINGFSKSHAMTGLRLGYVAGPSHLIQAITTLQSQFTSCASSISQAAGVAALTQVSDETLQGLVQIMQDKRDYVVSQLATMPHVEMKVPPQGAFYVLPDVSYYCSATKDDADLCLDLLQRQSLAVVPGSSFGAPGTIRLSYATSWEELETAMTKLRTYFAEEEQKLAQAQTSTTTNPAVVA